MPIYSTTDVELSKPETINQLDDGKLTRAQAGVVVHLSVRQIQRLLEQCRQDGIDRLVSKKRCKPGNRALPSSF